MRFFSFQILLSRRRRRDAAPKLSICCSWRTRESRQCRDMVDCSSRTHMLMDCGHVAALGEVIPELGDLNELRTLSLRDNHLSGTVPRELGQLTNLKHLFLNNNDICGESNDGFEGAPWRDERRFPGEFWPCFLQAVKS